MTPRPLLVQCPSCGSGDITYTCEPKCCFIHICSVCYTTFQLFTEPLGRALTGFEKPLEERDSLTPTVACAQCGSIDVYMVEPEGGCQGELVCTECGSLLQLGFDAVESR